MRDGYFESEPPANYAVDDMVVITVEPSYRAIYKQRNGQRAVVKEVLIEQFTDDPDDSDYGLWYREYKVVFVEPAHNGLQASPYIYCEEEWMSYPQYMIEEVPV